MKKYIFIFSLIFFVSIQGFSQIRVACIGNSITEGFGLQHPDTEAYPAILGKLLGTDYEVVNFGISARTLLMKGDLPWMKEQQFRDVLTYNPNIVTIKLGTNDTKPHNWKYGTEFQKDLETLILILQGLPSKPTIYLCYPIPVYQNNWGIRDSIVVNDIIPIIQNVANEFNLTTIDLHSRMPQSYYLNDNVHPSAKGSQIIAQKIYAIIKQ